MDCISVYNDQLLLFNSDICYLLAMCAVTHAGGSSGGRVNAAVCVFLFICTISHKQMQLGSPNVT